MCFECAEARGWRIYEQQRLVERECKKKKDFSETSDFPTKMPLRLKFQRPFFGQRRLRGWDPHTAEAVWNKNKLQQINSWLQSHITHMASKAISHHSIYYYFLFLQQKMQFFIMGFGWYRCRMGISLQRNAMFLIYCGGVPTPGAIFFINIVFYYRHIYYRHNKKIWHLGKMWYFSQIMVRGNTF